MNSQADIPAWAAEAQAHYERAQSLYEETEEYEEALRECDAAVELDPDLAEAHNLRGVLLEELGRPVEALSAYHEALRVRPQMEEAAENLQALEGEMEGGPRLVTVATTGFPATAQVLKGKLEAAGIPAVIIGEEIVQTFWPQAMGGIKVQVREEDRDEALDVLGLREEVAQLEAEYWEDGEEAGQGPAGDGTKGEADGDHAESTEAPTAEHDAGDEGAEESLEELTEEAVALPPEDDLLAQEAAAAPPPPPCPQCGSLDVQGVTSLLGDATGKWTCDHCGYEWENQ